MSAYIELAAAVFAFIGAMFGITAENYLAAFWALVACFWAFSCYMKEAA